MTLTRLALSVALLVPLACDKAQAPAAPPTAEPAASEPSTGAEDGEPPAAEGAAAAGSRKAGAACLAADECDSGVCEGEGCGDGQPGTCAEAGRMCTRDYVTYCGCDGESFGASGSCPGQRYAHKGDC